MVNYNDELDQVFKALADPTRRDILERLSRAQAKLSAGELARPFQISLPAISKHLKYLEASGLIIRSRQGRNYLFAARPQPVEEANWWIAEYLHFYQTTNGSTVQAESL
ncbi:MAG TPA: metalloregulator ArsR/SmtB family transcription factor [Candidatus Saccharimonadales bacterium]|nr:metalloregulator ArsR/SmtB family transcription factor [Candidatus Saccharimonadales bacterium]